VSQQFMGAASKSPVLAGVQTLWRASSPQLYVDVDRERAKALGVPVLLGSATPSRETLATAEAGRYTRLRLPRRAGAARPPRIDLVDLRGRKLHHGLAPATIDAIEATIERDEQVLVFRNRRGYAPVLLCHDCGWSAQCPHCDRPLTLHGRGR
jgi:primosomal protein N' (replication factor Y)